MPQTEFAPPRIDPELPPSTDPLGEVLQLLKLKGVLYCDATLSRPWGVEIPYLPGVINVEVVTSGHCWLELEGREPVFLPEGSLVLIPRGNQHRLKGNPGDRATHLENIPVRRSGDLFETMVFGGGGETTRITYYGVRFDPFLADRLVSLLPDVLHLRTGEEESDWLHNTIRFIDDEARKRLPGCETIITRLADVLVIQAIRTWTESAREEKSGWIAALHDPKIGAALLRMHRDPAADWRVETLAREVGMSRSGFSARFTGLVGESVMQYLTGLRIQLAYRELHETTDSLARIAERVGYQSEPAFNRAFKRVTGVSPGSVRKSKRVN